MPIMICHTIVPLCRKNIDLYCGIPSRTGIDIDSINGIIILEKLVAPYATSGAYENSWDALRADSNLRAYGTCRRRDGTEGTPEPNYRCYRRRASTLSVTTRRAGRSSRRMDLAAAAGARATRMILLWASWRSWWMRSGATPRYWTNDYTTAGSGPTRH